MTREWKDIDLNCDLGEGIAEDEKIIPLISSCSLACGGHAGDLDSLTSLLLLAREHGTRAGAHPSYPDREYFGRKSMDLSPSEWEETIVQQVELFLEATRRTRTSMHHIKAHGALYNDLGWNTELSDTYLGILLPYREKTRLYAPCGSPMVLRAREQGFQVIEEGFADRAYQGDGRLVSRRLEGALLTRPEDVWNQVREMVLFQRVKTRDGGSLRLYPETLCLHGDTPNSLEILTYLRQQFPENHIRLA